MVRGLSDLAPKDMCRAVEIAQFYVARTYLVKPCLTIKQKQQSHTKYVLKAGARIVEYTLTQVFKETGTYDS